MSRRRGDVGISLSSPPLPSGFKRELKLAFNINVKPWVRSTLINARELGKLCRSPEVQKGRVFGRDAREWGPARVLRLGFEKVGYGLRSHVLLSFLNTEVISLSLLLQPLSLCSLYYRRRRTSELQSKITLCNSLIHAEIKYKMLNILTLALAAGAGASRKSYVTDPNDIEFGNIWWFVYAGVSCLLVLFAGIMSGLTLGLMSLGVVELEILQRSGTNREKKQAEYYLLLLVGHFRSTLRQMTLIQIFAFLAAAILPVVQKQHQLLVTLLLCNAAAMEVIPQAISTRYGLAVGANFVGLVRVLMIICYPIAYPVLDVLIGHNDALFRRAQLKALVSIHGQEAGKGGELTHDETTIISGALDLTEKTAEEAMTPIESTFSLDVNSKLDWEAIGKILAKGHSRVPVYSGNPKNIIGLLLLGQKQRLQLALFPLGKSPGKFVFGVPADLPLYDILNEFQKGSSHMAAVVKVKSKEPLPADVRDRKLVEKNETGHSQLTKPLLPKLEEELDFVVNVEKTLKPTVQHTGGITKSLTCTAEDLEDGEVIGIITLEDVFEELLQEEIVDETDVYVDVHKRIRVAAAAAAASFVARTPSTRRLAAQRPTGVKEDKDKPPALIG
ncbi:protein of unknown function DUF21 [Cynara cardunculus var. scolymus]|uniref:CNNM transmembrane domain-containing protein n=1 Tax=Cynara cardunculus var. scolymus TaxID=59895 RepID=A0A103XP62_CYNCS|nr:protein of unknown function DUF21 [Cynara cardunculus var. scolymus]